MLRSQLLSAHTHSHTRQTRCKRTHTRSHPVRRSRSRAPLLHYNNRFVLLFSVGIVSNQEKTEKQGRRTEERKTSQIFAAVVLHSIHQQGVRLSMSRRRTLLMGSSFKRGHLSDQDPCGAMPKWMYHKRGKTIQPLVLKSRWEGKSHQSLDFVRVFVVVFVVFFFLF